ncbi:MAG: electron transport complex subunit RsxC [Ruminococcaceae bacterium]|nr:electron transport complex subunit RsxC [Oscillospiraceae bacterium]
MAYTFRGGAHVPEHKNTASIKIRTMPAPKMLSIPLSQHIGAPCTPTIKVGDTVDKYQVIGDFEKGLGCPVHSSVSGKVVSMEEIRNPMGNVVTHIVIENDGEERVFPGIKPYEKSFDEITADDLIDITKRAGISGMGGATFPTHAKISSALGKVDRLIINCAECEPYITANHRLMLEFPDDIIGGVKILLKVFGLRDGDIAIEDNKPDAIKLFREKTAESDIINVKVMKTKYPQGDERQLIYALTGRQIPSGKLPADVGCVVFNAETCAAIYRAFAQGIPLTSRIVTIDGDCIKEPCSVLCKIGTPISHIVEHLGGFAKEPHTVVNGGPMMGAALWDINAPVTKGTSAILVFSKDVYPEFHEEYSCIRCGRCVNSCQMGLMPNYIAMFAGKRDYSLCEKYDVLSCVECGACTYVCPGNVPITQLNRVAKAKIIEKRRNEAAKEAAKNDK